MKGCEKYYKICSYIYSIGITIKVKSFFHFLSHTDHTCQAMRICLHSAIFLDSCLGSYYGLAEHRASLTLLQQTDSHKLTLTDHVARSVVSPNSSVLKQTPSNLSAASEPGQHAYALIKCAKLRVSPFINISYSLWSETCSIFTLERINCVFLQGMLATLQTKRQIHPTTPTTHLAPSPPASFALK